MDIGVYQFVIASLRSVHFSLLYDGFAFRIDRVLKSGDISWRCPVKNCKGRIKTDEHSSAIINGNCNHMHESDSRKIQKQIIHAVVKQKAASDITTCPIKLVRCELLSIEEYPALLRILCFHHLCGQHNPQPRQNALQMELSLSTLIPVFLCF